MNPRLAAAACLTAAGVVLFACDPASAAIYPICPFHWLTGLYCPVCGSIRGAHALLHGHPLDALRCNVLVIGVLGYGIVVACCRRMALPVLAARPVPRRPLVLFALMLGFTVVRNVPGAVGVLFRP